MALIGIDRWMVLMKRAMRFRGPYALDGGEQLQPGYDLATEHPEFDDQIAYWHTTVRSIGALAANFSTGIIHCTQGRAIVDGIQITGQAAVQLYVMNLVTGHDPTTGTPIASWMSNCFVGRQGRAQPISLAPITCHIEQSVGGRLAGAGFGGTVPAAGDQFSWREGSMPPWIISQGSQFALPDAAFVIETNVVNLPLGFAAWGRWFPEVDPA